MLTYRLKCNHPAHGPEYIPCLHPSFIRDFGSSFKSLKSLCVEDVDGDGWQGLTEMIARNGQELRVLNLEAISEKDPFASIVGLGTMFPTLKKLECVRIDVYLT